LDNDFNQKRLSMVTTVGTTRNNKKKLIELNPSKKSFDLRTKATGNLSPVAV